MDVAGIICIDTSTYNINETPALPNFEYLFDNSQSLSGVGLVKESQIRHYWESVKTSKHPEETIEDCLMRMRGEKSKPVDTETSQILPNQPWEDTVVDNEVRV
jgi:hypothetical protein